MGSEKRGRTSPLHEEEGSSSNESCLISCLNLIAPYLPPPDLANLSTTSKLLHQFTLHLTSLISSDASRGFENLPVPFINNIDSHPYHFFYYTPYQTLPSLFPTSCQPCGVDPNSRLGFDGFRVDSDSSFEVGGTRVDLNSRFGPDRFRVDPDSRFGPDGSRVDPVASFGSDEVRVDPDASFGSDRSRVDPNSRFGFNGSRVDPKSRFGFGGSRVDPNSRFGVGGSRADPFLFRVEGGRGCVCERCDEECGCFDDEDELAHECGPSCRCDLECGNRASQRGLGVKLKIVKDVNKGWTLIADEFIGVGTFVCEYAGELLTTGEAKRRQEIYDELSLKRKLSPALLVVREHLSSGNVCIRINVDATRIGNIARFINHSCDGGNLSPVIVRSSGALLPRICFFASRDIQENEELTFSYGEVRLKANGLRCFCGSSSCYGILPSEIT